MRRVFIIVAVFLVPLIPIVLVLSGVLKGKPQTVAPVTLTVWGTIDSAPAINALAEKYRQTRSYTTITYTQVRPEDYVGQLVSAWAQGTGPDIFFVPSSWIGQMSQYAVAMPANLTVPQVIVSKGTFGTTTKVLTNPKPAPSLAALETTFIEAVTKNVIRDNQVWGLPLGVDTLVMYYNRDLTNNSKIFEPAKTWSELQSHINKNRLTVTDEQGKIIQSGVALGTVNNLPYATDLLTLLMMQNGSPMTTGNRQAYLNDASSAQAIQFFLSFAQPKKNNYSWDESLGNARDVFLQGKVGYYFGTLADRTVMEASSLNWGVTPMLHIRETGDNDGVTKTERYIDSAQYQVAMVSKASSAAKRSTQAWSFVEFVTQSANIQPYLQMTNRLPAMLSLLSKQQDDPVMGVYAKQLLTAKTWYTGNDGSGVDKILQELITNALTETSSLQELLDLANKRIQATL